MDITSASYKYCRKSPYEAKASFFGSPSNKGEAFCLNRQTLLIQKIDFKFFCWASSEFFSVNFSIRIRGFEYAYLEGFLAFWAMLQVLKFSS